MRPYHWRRCNVALDEPRIRRRRERLEDFSTATTNSNKHSELGMGLLADSMRRDGYTSPMVTAADGEAIIGSARLEKSAEVFPDVTPIVVESDGTRPIIVVRTDIESASSPQAQRIGAMDNRISQVNYQPDASVIEQMVKAGVIDGKVWGNRDDLQALMRSLHAHKGESPDGPQQITRADELLEKWQVQRGDLFRIPSTAGMGDHRLLCGDSTSADDVARLMGGGQFAVLFTDPPYGIAYDTTSYGRSKRDLGAVANDALVGEKFTDFLYRFLTTLKPHGLPDASLYICMANSTYHHLVQAIELAGIRYAVPIIWYKNHFALNWDRYKPQHELILHGGEGAIVEDEFAGYRIDGQFIFYGGVGSKPTASPQSRWFGPRNESTVWQIPRDPVSSYEHPTQKPVALAQRAIRNSSRPDEVILDLFAGSGSTLAGADLEGRLGYGMEYEPKFCSVILERLTLLGLHPIKVDEDYP